jgi:hypothetical protein
MIPLARFSGGRTLTLWAGALGALGLGATLAGYFAAPRETLFSYEFAFVYWLGLAVGMLLLLAAFHASAARWVGLFRRLIEVMSLCCAPLALLFVPVALGMPKLFVWASPSPVLGQTALELLQHKRPYLNGPFFLVRAVSYFALWVLIAYLLLRWSRRQDESGDLTLTLWQRRLSAGSLPWVGLALSFASLDWVLALEPLSASTIHGFYFFSGSFLGALALTTLVALAARGENLPGPLLTPAHLSSLGRLLLAMTAFWGYIAFCQYMLTWIADLPREVPFYFSRTKPGWRATAIVVATGQFLLPFAALLSKRVKLAPKVLASVSLWILAAHAVDTYWLVMPALHPDRPWPRWTDLSAFLGIGGVLVAFCTWLLRGGYAVPIKDPFLRHSLQYDQV